MLARHPGRSPDFAVSLLLASRAPSTTATDAGLLDLDAALNRELFSIGVPGTSRAGGGVPPGPGRH
jgi:hypothetical protein